MQWPQKFGSCHKAGMLVFHHESWPCYGCILFMPWRLLQFNITIDKGVVGTLIHIIGNSYQLSYSFSIIVKSLSKMWQPLASTFCSHRIGSLECQCFGCQKMSTPANLQSSSPVGSLGTSAAGFLQPLGLVAVRTIFYALLALLSFWFIFEVPFSIATTLERIGMVIPFTFMVSHTMLTNSGSSLGLHQKNGTMQPCSGLSKSWTCLNGWMTIWKLSNWMANLLFLVREQGFLAMI